MRMVVNSAFGWERLFYKVTKPPVFALKTGGYSQREEFQFGRLYRNSNKTVLVTLKDTIMLKINIEIKNCPHFQRKNVCSLRVNVKK